MRFQFCRFLIYIVFIFQIFSCSKSDPATPPVTPPVTVVPGATDTPVVKNCQIIAQYQTNGAGDTTAVITYTYLSDGRISGSLNKYTDINGTYSVSFMYNGNMIYRAVAAGVNSSVDTITLNANGMISKDKEVVGASTWISNWVYDANQQLTNFNQQQDAYPPYTATYVFTNGDNTLSTTAGFASDTLAYDLTKPAVHGNQDEVNQLLSLGAMYIKNKHLVVSANHGSSITYSYEYNSDGNISKMKITAGSNVQYESFTYQCK
jgi:YD repeat-containing protein